jgi:hypothetical protein
MGFEQEMALCATKSHGASPDPEMLLNEISAIAAESLVHLRGMGDGGIFLANGGRLYVDCQKYEYASPECSSPDEIVKYLLAGERILAKLTSELARKFGLDDAALYRCNVDYTRATTWGAHESYLTRSNPTKLAKDLIPFFVARVVTAGAGGFHPLTETGCSFTLSPRAWHICVPMSHSSTGSNERGIFHVKDEPLASRGYHRLHVLVGDALCSQKQNWLKFAATSIAVALADAGLHPGRKVALCAPVEALREFASDPTCKVKARACLGGELSAIDIQRHYLELARHHMCATWMPSWAPEAIEKWEAMLRQLDGAPDSVATCLDWAIKYRVFQSHIEKKGFDRQWLSHWTHLADLLLHCSHALPDGPSEGEQFIDRVLSPRGVLRNIVGQLTRHLHSRSMKWEQLESYMKLRSELFALDLKFGRLGEMGIFNRLDRAGVLDHRLPGVDDAQIDHAAANPPPIGRAKLRGEAIRRLFNKSPRDASNWMSVYDSTKGMVLNLNDPFATKELWSRTSEQDVEEHCLI